MELLFEDQLIGAPSTVRTQKLLFRKWVRPEITAGVEISDRSLPSLIQKWQSQGLKPGTVGILVVLCSKYCRWQGQPLQVRGLLRILKRQTVREVKALTFDQALQLLRYAQDSKHYLFVLLGLHCGLRIGEICALRKQSFNFQSGQILIEASRDVATKLIGPTKTGETRLIPMSAPVKLEAAKQLSKGHTDFLFPDGYNPYRWFPTLCKKAKVPVITPHGLRHTFCSLLLEKGASPKRVAELAGHSVMTTMTTYWWTFSRNMDLSALPDAG